MKKLLLNTLVLFFACAVSAQAPQKICYQAAAKDAQGADLTSQEISIRASVLKGGPSGQAEWVETHSNPLLTDAFGLFSIDIGDGDYSGGTQTNFSEIDWSDGPFWLKIEMDPNGGQNYTTMGTSQILSVPYSLYANTSSRATTADEALTALDDFDRDSSNEIQSLLFDNGELFLVDPNGNPTGDPIDFASALANFDNDPLNELQTLSTQNGELLLLDPNGNPIGDPIDLGTAVPNLDNDPANELQTLSTQNGELVLLDPSGNPIGDPIDLASALPNLDNDPVNELQTLSAQNGELVLLDPSGNAIGDPVDLATALPNLDNDPANELQELTYEDGIISISGGNEINLMNGTGFNAPGSSSDFPQGIAGEHILLTDGTFLVPDGKVFWVTAGPSEIQLNNIGPPPTTLHPTTPNMPVFSEGVVVENCMCTGMLVDTTHLIEPVVIDFITGAGTYQVPDGKVLFIKSGLKNDQPGRLHVNGMDMTFLSPSFTRGTRIMSFPEDTNIQAVPNAFGEIDIILTGYLLDRIGLVNPLGN